MISIAIVRDEKIFGRRAYETISKKFKTEIIDVESPSGVFIDDIELDDDIVDNLSKFDLIITYVKQADMTLELVEALHDKVSWIIVGIWKGKGFKNQLLKYKNVSIPDAMCELETNANPVYNEFTSSFGKPEIRINCQGERIADIIVLRGSPCGVTDFIADDLIGKDVEGSAKLAGLRVQHYPCKIHKLQLSKENDTHKPISSKLHHDAVEKALKNKRSMD